MTLSDLEALSSFALLAPGYSVSKDARSRSTATAAQLPTAATGENPEQGAADWTLFRELHESQDGALVFARFESASAQRFTGEAARTSVRLTAPTDATVRLEDPGYAAAIDTIREAIAGGDVYQVCLTLRARVTGATGAQLLSALCSRGTPRFAAWVRLPDGTEFVSGSPELLLSTEESTVRSEPMKGTARRGAETELGASEKDRAELAMITDLVRNDLAPVCHPRSIRVITDREQVVLPYAVQTVSIIEGQLAPGRTDLDALAAMHPGGSVTGAPKQAALECIRRLEPTARGAYCGVLGLRTEAQSRYALLIRTAERSGDEWSYGVGSGVVYDSRADLEWAELRVKLGALGLRDGLTLP